MPRSGLQAVERFRPRVVLLDLVIPGADGLSALDDILRFSPETGVILVTGNYSTDSAVEAIRKGASDYLTKPVSVSLLRERVGKLIEAERRRVRVNRLSAELMETCQFQGMVGSSPLMLEVFDRIRRAAPHFRTALVTGPTGTGKELVARALHSLSPVRSKTLAVSNCSAIVETLFESELFGHVKGAFTGAVADKVGFFEYAAGGTVFLDEIGDMPLSTQTKLLRVIENREYQRVGISGDAQDRRSHHRRHQPRSAEAGLPGRLPRRSLLPPFHDRDQAALRWPKDPRTFRCSNATSWSASPGSTASRSSG